MKLTTLNFIVDSIALADLIFLTLTGLVIHYILPPHSRNATFWEMTRHEWGDIHFMMAVVFIAAMAIHLYLHWSWIGSRFTGKGATSENSNRL